MTLPGVDSPRSHSIHDDNNFAGSGRGRGNSASSMAGRVATYAPDMTDWRRTFLSRDSFFPVLALALLCIAASPIIDSYRWGFVATFPFLALLVLASLHRSRVSPEVLRIAWILLIVAAIGTIVTTYARHIEYGDERILVAITSFLFALLYIVAIPSVTRRAFQHARVTVNTLAAGLTAYLLIGILFAALYRGVAALEDFRVFDGIVRPAAGDYAYFSFITMTTVGYGDLAPATGAMRVLAVFEAIIGQVFLVTAVARIVSLLGQQQDRLPIDTMGEPQHDLDPDSPD